MPGIQIVSGILVALAATAGEASSVHAADVDMRLRAELEHVAQQSIFFGHQSVGTNILDGVKQLAAMAGVQVRIAEVPAGGVVAPATLGHAWVGENGKPLLKLQAFERAMGQQPAGLDVALVKFCYLDITAETDVKALFARYRATIDSLRPRNPGTTFLHVTTPLTDVQGGPKAFLKKLLGRAPYGSIENVRRQEYNTLLRQAYGGREPIFDLARVESTAPDGSAVTTEWLGTVAPALVSAYTDDGSHLNTIGKLRAAREFVSVLAAVPERPSAGRPAR